MNALAHSCHQCRSGFVVAAFSEWPIELGQCARKTPLTPFWHISIDHLRDSGVLPLKRFKSGEFRWADAREAFFGGFHASLRAYADAGNNLILEHILDTDGWMETLSGLLAPHDVFFVAVHCPLELLAEREAARGDRPIGSARRDYETIHTTLNWTRRTGRPPTSKNSCRIGEAAIALRASPGPKAEPGGVSNRRGSGDVDADPRGARSSRLGSQRSLTCKLDTDTGAPRGKRREVRGEEVTCPADRHIPAAIRLSHT